MTEPTPAYRATLDSLLEGFQIISQDWTYLYVNPAAARHGRQSVSELHGRKIWEAYPGIDQTPLFQTLKRCMLERTAASFEHLFRFPDGTQRWFEIRVQPVPEGISVQSIDIQDRKDAEAALREQASVAALGRMAAVVAHEVKNPLAGLSGALQVLKSRRKPEDPEHKIFNEMLASIRSLDRLLRDLLIFARPIQITPAPISIGEVVNNALLVLDSDESFKRHHVTRSLEGPSPIVRGDADLLKGVFRNLLLNAAQAMPGTGSIDIRVAHEGSMCHVTVADTGPGVAAELAERLFQPFVTNKRGGTGLGLSTSRHILRLHGGDLSLVQSNERGAIFLVTVPIDTAAPSAQPSA